MTDPTTIAKLVAKREEFDAAHRELSLRIAASERALAEVERTRQHVQEIADEMILLARSIEATPSQN